MRAVNLIPPDARRGEGTGRSAAGAYALLAGLGALVLAVGAYAFASHSINTNRTKLVELDRQATQTEREAQRLRAYYDFAQMRETRVATIKALAESRFDWERTMRQLARVLPSDVMLTKFLGTVRPGVTVEGVSVEDPAGLRASQPVPAFQLVGCTDDQADVARVMSRLRRMTGVTRVSLSQSEKPDSASNQTSVELSSEIDCRFDYTIPRFNITVFFRPLPGAAGAAAPAPGQPGVPAQPAAGTQPTAGSGGSR